MTHPGNHAQQTTSGTTDVTSSPAPPEVIGHAEMDSAFEHGLAIPVSQSTGWLMRYRDAWWVLFEDGWLRVPEGPVADVADRLYPRLAAAEAEAARDRERDQE